MTKENKKFYTTLVRICIPIIIQNTITNLVNLIDNFMVSSVGTDAMAGVSVINQCVLVFNLCLFGIVSGVGIFGAQFYGKRDYEGLRDTLRIKLIITGITGILGILIFVFAGDNIIMKFLHDSSNSDVGNIDDTFNYAKEYLNIILWGFIPFAISQAYVSTLRETEETMVPMIASSVAVITNTIINYLLIYGKFGMPHLGAKGAAIGTIISKYIEAIIVIGWAHLHVKDNPYIKGLYRSFKVSTGLLKDVIKKGTPLVLNETLWAAAQATLTRWYAQRGLVVLGAMTISSTITNLFLNVTISFGSTIAIIVGGMLGANKLQEAKHTGYRLIKISTLCSLVIGMGMYFIAPLFILLYKAQELEVKQLAISFMRVAAICMPINGFLNAAYFTIRSGGKTVITFLFDSVYLWVISIPLVSLLVTKTDMNIVAIYATCLSVDLIKCAIGWFILKKEIWLQNLVADE